MDLKYVNIYYPKKAEIKSDGVKTVRTNNFRIVADVDLLKENHWLGSTYRHYFEEKNSQNDSGYRDLQIALEVDDGEADYYFVPATEEKQLQNETELLTNGVKLHCLKKKVAGQTRYFYYQAKHFEERYGHTYQRGYLVGESTPGTVNIIKKEVGQNYRRVGQISFEPSTLTVAEYEEMLSDIYQIHFSLLMGDDQLPTRTGITKKMSALSLKKQILKLEQAVKKIAINPNTTLSLERSVQNIQQLKKFNLKMELNKKLQPGKKNWLMYQLKETKATKENQLIKQLLKDLQKYLKGMKASSSYQTLFFPGELLEEHASAIPDQKWTDFYDFYPGVQADALKSRRRLLVKFLGKKEGNQSQISLKESSSQTVRKGSLIYSNYSPFVLAFDRASTTSETQSQQNDNPYIRTHELSSNHVLSHYLVEKLYRYLKEARRNDQIQIEGEITQISSTYRNLTKIYAIKINGQELWQPSESELRDWVQQLPEYEEESQLLERSAQIQEQKRIESEKYKAKLREEIEEVEEVVEELLSLDFFKQTKLTHRLPVVPSQVFLHNPFYQQVWILLQNLHAEIEFSIHMNESVLATKTDSLPNLYELWVYFKMIHVLTKDLGWTFMDEKQMRKDIVSYYQQSSQLDLARQQRDFAFVTEAHFRNGPYEIKFVYEPRLHFDQKNPKRNRLLTPDFLFIFSKNNEVLGQAILDAKFRDYQGSEQQWVRDIELVLFEKYTSRLSQQVDPSISEEQLSNLVNVSLLHPDINLAENNHFPYDVLINREENGDWRFQESYQWGKGSPEVSLYTQSDSEERIATPHKYSSLPLRPTETGYFKNWLRMMMEYHFKVEEVCWKCGNIETVKREVEWTKGGREKRIYKCDQCYDFWISSHCYRSKCRSKLYKHVDNYHSVSSKTKWNVNCPSCLSRL